MEVAQRTHCSGSSRLLCGETDPTPVYHVVCFSSKPPLFLLYPLLSVISAHHRIFPLPSSHLPSLCSSLRFDYFVFPIDTHSSCSAASEVGDVHFDLVVLKSARVSFSCWRTWSSILEMVLCIKKVKTWDVFRGDTAESSREKC